MRIVFRAPMLNLMHMHQSNQSDIPQTLVGISFETAFRAQEFLVAASGLAAPAVAMRKLESRSSCARRAGPTGA